MDAPVWGDHFDDGQGELTGHMLAMTPDGAQAGMRLGAGANQRTPYLDRFERLERLVGAAYRAVLE